MRRSLLLIAAPAALALLLAGCGDDSGAGAGPGVQVTSTDDSCTVASTELPAGTTKFSVRNDGKKVTEVYVYGQQGDAYSRVVSEVEDIGPGTSRTMTAKLPAGSYEIACKPGQTGSGIRQRITVK